MRRRVRPRPLIELAESVTALPAPAWLPWDGQQRPGIWAGPADSLRSWLRERPIHAGQLPGRRCRSALRALRRGRTGGVHGAPGAISLLRIGRYRAGFSGLRRGFQGPEPRDALCHLCFGRPGHCRHNATRRATPFRLPCLQHVSTYGRWSTALHP